MMSPGAPRGDTLEWSATYRLRDEKSVLTPAVAVYPERIREHLDRSIAMVGGPARMRPHLKTHKTREIAAMELDRGVTKHKCATIAEAELLAEVGAADVLIAYPLVGPNVARFAELMQHYSKTRFSALVDHPRAIDAFAAGMRSAGLVGEVLLDIDVGMGRTGARPGEAFELYRRVVEADGLTPGGLHGYDGHNKEADRSIRAEVVASAWGILAGLASSIDAAGWPLPRIVCGGTPGFSIWAEFASRDPRIECSPGTFFVNDWGYFRNYAEIPFQPAAVVLTRVISRPGTNLLTLDVGSKAIAPDSDAPDRAFLLNVPEARLLKQWEEHLLVESPAADDFLPGDLVYAWPKHVCPTIALHRELLVVERGEIVGTWPVLARDRQLTC